VSPITQVLMMESEADAMGVLTAPNDMEAKFKVRRCSLIPVSPSTEYLVVSVYAVLHLYHAL
jgi:hypothetical protein